MTIKHSVRRNKIYLKLRSIHGFIRWRARNYASPSPQFIKLAVLLRNAIPSSNWVETGTFLGETTTVISKHAKFVYSIEPEPTLFSNAVLKFQSYPNVQIIRGLSEEVFPVLLPMLSGSTNFWLDGHYSQGITYKGPQDTPILDELACISRNLHRFGKICVMIDDVRCFDPKLDEYSSYPTINLLVTWANQNGLHWQIEHDIFIAKS